MPSNLQGHSKAATAVHICGKDVGRPGHVCGFFDSRRQEYDVAVPFLREGVDAGDEVLTVIDASRVAEHRTRLAADGVTAADGVIVESSENTYLLGGSFDMDTMESFVATHLRQAGERGHRVRTAGWMDWIHSNVAGADRAIEYEARMNLLVPQYDCTFLCMYDLSKLSGTMIVDIMATHPWVILNGDIRENAFYIPPTEYLELLKARRKLVA